MKILIVEDNDYKFKDIENALHSCGETDIARNCCRNGALLELAIAEEENRMYDLVILDMQLPRYDGNYEISKKAGMEILRETKRRRYKTSIAFCSSEPVDCEDTIMNILYDSSVYLTPTIQELLVLVSKNK